MKCPMEPPILKFPFDGVVNSDGVLKLSDKPKCRNLNLGLTTKARSYKGAGQERDLKVTSHTPGSAKSVRA